MSEALSKYQPTKGGTLTVTTANAITDPPSGPAVRRYWIEFSDLNWGFVFLLYTVIGLITASTVYTAELASGNPRFEYFYPLIWEMTGHWTSFLLLPVVVWIFSRLRIQRQNWLWTVPVHVLASMAIGVVHTLLMYASRVGIYRLLDLGSYNYGEMGYRFAMEYHKQFLAYWLVYAVLRVVAHYRESRDRERLAVALELKASELEKELAQVQLQALRSQLNPHFLFNTLNMVSSVMYEDVNRADQMIVTLSRMLRMSLEENVGPRVPVRRELEFVTCAAELIRARFQEGVEIDIQCPPDVLDAMMPNLLLHTLIENSIKHHDSDGESVIRVQARVKRNESSLEIDVLDNGPGVEDPARALGQGVGLSNTRQRLLALYGDRHSFVLRNRQEAGLHVHVVIPYEPSQVRCEQKSERAPRGEMMPATPGLAST